MHVLSECMAGIILATSLSAQSPAGGASDEAAVREVIKSYMVVREHQDAHALEALCTADVDQLVSSREWRKGLSEVVRGTLASSQNSGGKRTITVESVRFVAPGVALAAACRAG